MTGPVVERPRPRLSGAGGGGRLAPAARLMGAWLVGVWGLMLVLAAVGIDRLSLSSDGSFHLLAGSQALHRGQNLVNLEHPPMAKLAMGWPLLLEDDPWPEPVDAAEALPALERLYEDPARLERVTRRARWTMLLLFAVPWLLASGALAGEMGYRWGRRIMPLLLAGTAWVFPNLFLLQTDVAVSLGAVLVVWLSIRGLRRPPWETAMLVGTALGFALSGKFSGVLLVPTALLGVWLGGGSLGRRLGRLAAALAVAALFVHFFYGIANWSYDREAGRETLRLYSEGRASVIVGDRLEPWQSALLTIERVDPAVAQWLTGLLGVLVQNDLGVYPSYAFGRIRPDGWLWYFPTLLLVKTPWVLLILALGALVWRLRAGRSADELRGDWRIAGLIATTLGVYLAAAAGSSYNIGIRHLLPILPLLYLPLVGFLGRRRRWATAVVALLACELVVLAPFWLGATNTWWLGERNPTRLAFSASNLDYRLNLAELGREADRRALGELRVVHPGLEAKVLAAYAPQARLLRPAARLEPGWYAVNVLAEQLVPALLDSSPADRPALRREALRWQPVLAALAAGEDHGTLAATYRLFRLPAAVPLAADLEPAKVGE